MIESPGEKSKNEQTTSNKTTLNCHIL